MPRLWRAPENYFDTWLPGRSSWEAVGIGLALAYAGTIAGVLVSNVRPPPERHYWHATFGVSVPETAYRGRAFRHA